MRRRRPAVLAALVAGALSGCGPLGDLGEPVPELPAEGTPPPIAPVPLPPDPVPVAGATPADRSGGAAHGGRGRWSAPRWASASRRCRTPPPPRWCQDGTTAPLTDGFGLGSGVGSVTTAEVWVVARDRAPTADLVLRVSGLRDEAGSDASGPWDEVIVTGGGCADDPSALRVPLGG